METFLHPLPSEYDRLCKRPSFVDKDLQTRVEEILKNVKENGDQALIQYALDFDNILIDNFRVSSQDVDQIASEIDEDLKLAIDQAYENIHKFHLTQFSSEDKIETMPGVVCWRKSVGIEKVGIYVPGGTAPLFSTVLMLGIPAQIASCKKVVMCCPSNHPAIYYAARKCGIEDIYRIGGAQAIAAMAFGTLQVPSVYKIFGPGNHYVTIAKQLLSMGQVAIDMPAGPSEVAVYCDHTSIPSFVAADLLSQAEHGADSQVFLVSTNEEIVKKVQIELDRQLKELPRMEMAAASLDNSKAVILDSAEEAANILNHYAAEHLIIAIDNPHSFAEKITNAGSIFLGHFTPEACGDYASGTNHTLPTNAYAKAYSGVSVDSFVKKITHQEITAVGLKSLGPVVETMAAAEGLQAHKNAVTIRLKTIS